MYIDNNHVSSSWNIWNSVITVGENCKYSCTVVIDKCWLMCNCIDSDIGGESRRSAVAIVCTDFPRYFVAVSRVRLASCVVGNSGGSLKTDSMPMTSCVFPVGSVKKETKVGLQVAIQSDWLQFVISIVLWLFHSSIRSDIVTTVSHEYLEQFW